MRMPSRSRNRLKTNSAIGKWTTTGCCALVGKKISLNANGLNSDPAAAFERAAEGGAPGGLLAESPGSVSALNSALLGQPSPSESFASTDWTSAAVAFLSADALIAA